MHASRKPRALIVAIAVALGVLGLGAGSSGAATAAAAAGGGVLRIAAEEEPSCGDWIANCAGSSWGVWSLGIQTLPQALIVDSDGNYVPGPVLADFPTLDAGPPMKITYRIAPNAVWSDGQPITSKDFEYLWKQITTGKGIYDTTGYADIESIDTTDPKVAVVTMSTPYAAWRDLFGGFNFLLPSHLLEGKNRHKEMKDGYAFSGGPWTLDGGKAGWKRGKTITLVPNPDFWGPKPSISKVVFQFITNSAAELQAVVTGQVQAAYPIPQQGQLDQLASKSNLTHEIAFGNEFEGFWINAAHFPFNSTSVRQAVLYATDRQAIVDQIVKPSAGEGRVLQSFIVPTFRQYYMPTFATYDHDPTKVDELMQGDGWKKNSAGIWAKNGRTASFQIVTTAGNKNRELTQQLWQSQLRQAGFDAKIKNASSDVLFGKLAPSGRFEVALFSSVGTPDPGLCVLFCSKNIPNKKNDFTGQNWTRLVSRQIDTLWSEADTELDATKRANIVKEGQVVLAATAISIPLFQQPSVFVYDHTKIGGPVGTNTVLGPFYNLNEWVLK